MKNYFKITYAFIFFSSTMLISSCSNENTDFQDEVDTLQINTSVSEAHKGPGFQTYNVDFGMLNDSGVTGEAQLTLDGNQLTVSIQASGLVPNEVHPQHIHGFSNNNRNSTCPPPSADTDGNGIISVPEGAPFYGGILVPLQPFPTADDDGNINFENTYTIDGTITPIQNRAIVLHGLVVDGEYEITVPVACGQVSVSKGK